MSLRRLVGLVSFLWVVGAPRPVGGLTPIYDPVRHAIVVDEKEIAQWKALPFEKKALSLFGNDVNSPEPWQKEEVFARPDEAARVYLPILQAGYTKLIGGSLQGHARALELLGELKRSEILPYCRRYLVTEQDKTPPILRACAGYALQLLGGPEAGLILQAGLYGLVQGGLETHGEFRDAVTALATTCWRPDSADVVRRYKDHPDAYIRLIVGKYLPQIEAPRPSPATGLTHPATGLSAPPTGATP